MASRAALLLSIVLTFPVHFAHGQSRLDEAESQMAKGDEYYERGQYEAAAAYYATARALAPQKPGPHLWLGLAHAAAGNCKEAMPALEQYAKLKREELRPEAVARMNECKEKLRPKVEPPRPEPARAESPPSEPGRELTLDVQAPPPKRTKPLWIIGVVVPIVVVGVALGVGLGVGLSSTSTVLPGIGP